MNGDSKRCLAQAFWGTAPSVPTLATPRHPQSREQPPDTVDGHGSHGPGGPWGEGQRAGLAWALQPCGAAGPLAVGAALWVGVFTSILVPP